MTLRRFFNCAFLLLALSLLPIPSAAQWTAPNPVVDFQKQPDGVLIHQKTGTLRLQVCSPAILHLTYSPTADFPATPNPVIIKTSWPQAKWKLEESADAIALTTSDDKSRGRSQDRCDYLHGFLGQGLAARRLQDDDAGHRQRREHLPRRRLHDARRLRLHRSHLRTRAASGRRLELSRRIG